MTPSLFRINLIKHATHSESPATRHRNTPNQFDGNLFERKRLRSKHACTRVGKFDREWESRGGIGMRIKIGYSRNFR